MRRERPAPSHPGGDRRLDGNRARFRIQADLAQAGDRAAEHDGVDRARPIGSQRVKGEQDRLADSPLARGIAQIEPQGRIRCAGAGGTTAGSPLADQRPTATNGLAQSFENGEEPRRRIAGRAVCRLSLTPLGHRRAIPGQRRSDPGNAGIDGKRGDGCRGLGIARRALLG